MTQQQTTIAGFRELRLLLEYRRQLYRLCKLAFSAADASIYLIPYAPSGQYYFGGSEIRERKAKETFGFKSQLSSNVATIPKLSIHEKGQVHAYVGPDRAGPLLVPPLANWRGQHAATVTVDRIAGLSVFQGTPRESGARVDFPLFNPADEESARVAIYINGKTPSFAGDCRAHFTLRRPALTRPLYVGFSGIAQSPLSNEDSKDGVTVIAGWDPRIFGTTAHANFLFIRGE